MKNRLLARWINEWLKSVNLPETKAKTLFYVVNLQEVLIWQPREDTGIQQEIHPAFR